jgi:hypothetical protein
MYTAIRYHQMTPEKERACMDQLLARLDRQADLISSLSAELAALRSQLLMAQARIEDLEAIDKAERDKQFEVWKAGLALGVLIIGAGLTFLGTQAWEGAKILLSIQGKT